MLEDTLRSPLMVQSIEITKEEAQKGVEYVTEIAQRAMLGRLTVIVDEDNLKEVFG